VKTSEKDTASKLLVRIKERRLIEDLMSRITGEGEEMGSYLIILAFSSSQLQEHLVSMERVELMLCWQHQITTLQH